MVQGATRRRSELTAEMMGGAASWRARARGSGKVAAVIQVKGVNEAARMAAFQVGQVVPGRDR